MCKKMPRIDPLQLLRCLSILLAPNGGIKSPENVGRLIRFMRAGGWELVSMWIMEAVEQNNGPLLEQLLELTLGSPLDLVQLQINDCPRAVKALTRDGPTQRVRDLALLVVESWVQMAREGLAKPTEAQPINTMQTIASPPSTVTQPLPAMQPVSTVQEPFLPQQQVFTQTPQPQQPQYVPIEPVQQNVLQVQPMHIDDQGPVVVNTISTDQVDNVVHGNTVNDVEMQEVPAVAEEQMHDEEEEEGDGEETGGSAEESEHWDAPLGQLPVYKITIRDGKQVLAKVYSGERPLATKNLTQGAKLISVPKNIVQAEPVAVVSASPTQAAAESPIPEIQTNRKDGPRGAARRKQQLKPSCTDAEAPLEMTETEKKKVATQEKISARLAKEQAAKRAERLLREKQAKLREKLAEREVKEKERRAKEQKEKDEATLAKLMGSNRVGSVGKIPKKSHIDDDKKHSTSDDRKSELRRSSSEEEKKKDRSSKSEHRSESKKDDSKKSPSSSKSDHKKELNKSSKSSSHSSPSHTPSSTSNHYVSSSKIKVKSFNSKPRSTGLEEQPPPPPPRGQSKKDKDKRSLLSLSKKRSSPPPGKDQTPPEKKPKPSVEEEAAAAKKLPSPKPKPKPAIHLLQESDFFMDALTAVSRPEPRKRKRRVSSSKDDTPPPGTPGTVKTESSKDQGASTKEAESPSESPRDSGNRKSLSPTVARPSLQFYTDTLETPKDVGETDEVNASDRTPTPPGDGGEEESKGSNDSSSVKGVLVFHRDVNRVKKTVRFRVEEELVSVLYFELDETERVNVTKTFGDMRLLDLEHERELMQNARKIASHDIQEEKTPWRPLIPIDCPPSLVEPGKNSREKDVQFAREKTVLQAIYFTASSIPDSPAEPDSENHPTTDPVTIPLDDSTGNPDSVKDFTNVPWPEPKVGPAPQSTFMTHAVSFPLNNTQLVHQPVAAGGGGWRTGDGQILAPGPGDVFPPNNFTSPHAGYETGNPAPYSFGYETPGGFMDSGGNFVTPPDMSNINNIGQVPNNFMFPPPGPGNFRQQAPGNWGPPMGVPPPMGGPGPMGSGPMGPGPMGGPPNDMRGGPRFRSGNMGPRGNRGGWQGQQRGGGPRGNKGWGGGGGGGGGNRGVCKHFRTGYCRNGESCNFLHPGVNGPNY